MFVVTVEFIVTRINSSCASDFVWVNMCVTLKKHRMRFTVSLINWPAEKKQDVQKKIIEWDSLIAQRRGLFSPNWCVCFSSHTNYRLILSLRLTDAPQKRKNILFSTCTWCCILWYILISSHPVCSEQYMQLITVERLTQRRTHTPVNPKPLR